ncbi:MULTISPECIES: NCS2 family permease [Brevibacterium]|uniref:NCS2 family permease n=1 Tax=Brevibacterium salitolerans TaxID=1403566 RepID=A0ABP5IST5_9MICO|nr:NCS2 family permease [Brevibacterium sp.]
MTSQFAGGAEPVRNSADATGVAGGAEDDRSALSENAGWGERIFRLRSRGSTGWREFTAGISMFLASAYSAVVIPGMLADAGLPRGAATTAVLIVVVLATALMGLYANMPFVLAPGLGGVALVAYTLVLGEGVPYPVAMGMVFWSGVAFLLLTLFGIRGLITQMIPTNIRLAIGSGIGLFIAFIGFRSAGLVVAGEDSLELGDLGGASAVVALVGLVALVGMQSRKVPGSFVIVIVGLTLVGIPLGLTEITGDLLQPPEGVGPLILDIDVMGALAPHYLPYLFAFFAAEFFSATGIVMAVSEKVGLPDSQMRKPFIVDSTAIIAGSLLAAPSVTTYAESTAGSESGGRTGLTSLWTAACFALLLVFAPFAAAIPAAATAPVLMFVGLKMLTGFVRVDVSDLTEAVPATLVVVCTLLWGNFGTGIAAGLLSYVLVKIFAWRLREVSVGMWIMAPFLVYFFVTSVH